MNDVNDVCHMNAHEFKRTCCSGSFRRQWYVYTGMLFVFCGSSSSLHPKKRKTQAIVTLTNMHHSVAARRVLLCSSARMERMATLEPLFVDVTWGAGGSTSDLTMAISANAQKYLGVEVLMHLTCTNLKVDLLSSLEDKSS